LPLVVRSHDILPVDDERNDRLRVHRTGQLIRESGRPGVHVLTSGQVN
jgi:hypothetical protein